MALVVVVLDVIVADACYLTLKSLLSILVVVGVEFAVDREGSVAHIPVIDVATADVGGGGRCYCSCCNCCYCFCAADVVTLVVIITAAMIYVAAIAKVSVPWGWGGVRRVA